MSIKRNSARMKLLYAIDRKFSFMLNILGREKQCFDFRPRIDALKIDRNLAIAATAEENRADAARACRLTVRGHIVDQNRDALRKAHGGFIDGADELVVFDAAVF